MFLLNPTASPQLAPLASFRQKSSLVTESRVLEESLWTKPAADVEDASTEQKTIHTRLHTKRPAPGRRGVRMPGDEGSIQRLRVSLKNTEENF